MLTTSFIAFLCFFTFVVIVIYNKISRKKFTPSEVIIGNKKYYDPENRLYINVIDFDGSFVSFTVEDESVIADCQVLTKEVFLDKFIKIPTRIE